MLLAISSLALRAEAQRSGRRQVLDRSSPQGNMPWNFFEESDADRAALEDIEIDPKEERRIGDADLDAHLASLRKQGVRVTERGKDCDYLSALVAQLRPLMKHSNRYPKIRVHVANTDDVDARAFPGGSIVVTTGMIEFARSEAALVGVFGHELSHIDHGHQLRAARAMQLAQSGWDSATRPEMQQRIMMMSRNFAKPFSAADEAAADRDGTTWAYELGYDPLEFAKVFARFDQRNPRHNRGVPSFLLTHPYNADRYAAIGELATELQGRGPHVVRYVGRTNLERRVPRTVRQFAE
jgi:beta-barrel assembly-enhancing protease